jgi:hypothetical protein
MSTAVARNIIRRWWKSAAGTRVVVGWMHSSYKLTNVNERLPTPENIKLVTVSRPMSTSSEHPEEVFTELLLNKVKEQNHDIVNVRGGQSRYWLYSQFWNPFFQDGHFKRSISHFFVWPAGVISNNKFDSGLAKIQELANKHELHRRLPFLIRNHKGDRARLSKIRAYMQPRSTRTKTKTAIKEISKSLDFARKKRSMKPRYKTAALALLRSKVPLPQELSRKILHTVRASNMKNLYGA